jgi:hypothetical protein
MNALPLTLLLLAIILGMVLGGWLCVEGARPAGRWCWEQAT